MEKWTHSEPKWRTSTCMFELFTLFCLCFTISPGCDFRKYFIDFFEQQYDIWNQSDDGLTYSYKPCDNAQSEWWSNKYLQQTLYTTRLCFPSVLLKWLLTCDSFSSTEIKGVVAKKQKFITFPQQRVLILSSSNTYFANLTSWSCCLSLTLFF